MLKRSEAVLEVGRKMLEGGRQRVTSNHSRKTRRPSEIVAPYGGLEPRDERRGTGSGRAQERLKKHKKTQKSYGRDAEELQGRHGRKEKKT